MMAWRDFPFPFSVILNQHSNCQFLIFYVIKVFWHISSDRFFEYSEVSIDKFQVIKGRTHLRFQETSQSRLILHFT